MQPERWNKLSQIKHLVASSLVMEELGASEAKQGPCRSPEQDESSAREHLLTCCSSHILQAVDLAPTHGCSLTKSQTLGCNINMGAEPQLGDGQSPCSRLPLHKLLGIQLHPHPKGPHFQAGGAQRRVTTGHTVTRGDQLLPGRRRAFTCRERKSLANKYWRNRFSRHASPHAESAEGRYRSFPRGKWLQFLEFHSIYCTSIPGRGQELQGGVRCFRYEE